VAECPRHLGQPDTDDCAGCVADDEIRARILAYVNARPDRDFNTSQLARAGKCERTRAWPVIDLMVGAHELIVVGRGGAWVRYRSRRFGEMNDGGYHR
jgi:hypothetical protein